MRPLSIGQYSSFRDVFGCLNKEKKAYLPSSVMGTVCGTTAVDTMNIMPPFSWNETFPFLLFSSNRKSTNKHMMLMFCKKPSAVRWGRDEKTDVNPAVVMNYCFVIEPRSIRGPLFEEPRSFRKLRPAVAASLHAVRELREAFFMLDARWSTAGPPVL